MPALAEEQTDALVVRWLHAEGEQVTAGEPIVEVETDKAVVEIESPVSGRLRARHGAEGERVAVGELLAEVEEAS